MRLKHAAQELQLDTMGILASPIVREAMTAGALWVVFITRVADLRLALGCPRRSVRYPCPISQRGCSPSEWGGYPV